MKLQKEAKLKLLYAEVKKTRADNVLLKKSHEDHDKSHLASKKSPEIPSMGSFTSLMSPRKSCSQTPDIRAKTNEKVAPRNKLVRTETMASPNLIIPGLCPIKSTSNSPPKKQDHPLYGRNSKIRIKRFQTNNPDPTGDVQPLSFLTNKIMAKNVMETSEAAKQEVQAIQKNMNLPSMISDHKFGDPKPDGLATKGAQVKKYQGFLIRIFLNTVMMQLRFCRQIAYIEENTYPNYLDIELYMKTSNSLDFCHKLLFTDNSMNQAYVNFSKSQIYPSKKNLDSGDPRPVGGKPLMGLFGGVSDGWGERFGKDGLEAGFINLHGSVMKKNIGNITRDFLSDKISEEGQGLWDWFVKNNQLLSVVFDYQDLKKKISKFLLLGTTDINMIPNNVMFEMFEVF